MWSVSHIQKLRSWSKRSKLFLTPSNCRGNLSHMLWVNPIHSYLYVVTVWPILNTWPQQSLYCILWSHGKSSSDISLHFYLFLWLSLLIHVDAALHNAIPMSLEITQYWGVEINTKQQHKLKFQGAMSRHQSHGLMLGTEPARQVTLTVFPKVPKDAVHCCIALETEERRLWHFFRTYALCLHLQMEYLTSNWGV